MKHHIDRNLWGLEDKMKDGDSKARTELVDFAMKSEKQRYSDNQKAFRKIL